MSSVQGSCCIYCGNYSPNATFPWIGLCKRDGKLVVSKPSCENFTEVDFKKVFDEGGWVHCLTCKKPVYSEQELSSHAGHVLAFEICSDEVACEESYAGD